MSVPEGIQKHIGQRAHNNSVHFFYNTPAHSHPALVLSHFEVCE